MQQSELAPSYKDKEIPPKDWMPTPGRPAVLKIDRSGNYWQVLQQQRENIIDGYMPDGYPKRKIEVSFARMPLQIQARDANSALAVAIRHYPRFRALLAVEQICGNKAYV